MPSSSGPPTSADRDRIHPPGNLAWPLVTLAGASCLGLALVVAAIALATPAGALGGYTLTLTAQPASGVTGTPATVTAVANMPLRSQGLYINIWRVGYRRVLKTCRTERCKVVVTPPGGGPSPAPTTTDTTYRAQISRYPRRHVPPRYVPGRVFANAKVTVGRTNQICHPPSCPTM